MAHQALSFCLTAKWHRGTVGRFIMFFVHHAKKNPKKVMDAYQPSSNSPAKNDVMFFSEKLKCVRNNMGCVNSGPTVS